MSKDAEIVKLFPFGLLSVERLPNFFDPRKDGYGFRFRDSDPPRDCDYRFVLTEAQVLTLASEMLRLLRDRL